MLQKEIQAEVDVLRRQGMGIRAIRRETGLARNTISCDPARRARRPVWPTQATTTEKPTKEAGLTFATDSSTGNRSSRTGPGQGRGPGSDRSQSEDREPDVFAPSVLSLGKSHGLLHKTSQMSALQRHTVSERCGGKRCERADAVSASMSRRPGFRSLCGQFVTSQIWRERVGGSPSVPATTL